MLIHSVASRLVTINKCGQSQYNFRGTSKNPSYPRRRVSSCLIRLDSRLRGSDEMRVFRGALRSIPTCKFVIFDNSQFVAAKTLAYQHLEYVRDANPLYVEEPAQAPSVAAN